jgi:RNA polymerase sigma-70 factor, ECF subfamily
MDFGGRRGLSGEEEMSYAPTAVSVPERGLIESARQGDEFAFQAIVEPYRRALHAHCYRMLGSAHDAEDALQDTLLRAWRGLPRFEGRSSLRSWLYRIATNVCLKQIQRRSKRVLPVDYGAAADPHEGPAPPLAESTWLEPYTDPAHEADGGLAAPDARYEQRESIELAFVAALQHLPPRQRAVLILRDVFGFSAAEVGEALHAAPDAIHSILQRAHRAVDERLPERSQQATLRSLGDEHLRRLVDSYVEAWENGDVDAILAMLTDDAVLAMPPRPSWFQGREAVGAFLAVWPLAEGRRWRLVPTVANGQLAFTNYLWDSERGLYREQAIQVLTLAEDGRIRDLTAFHSPKERWIAGSSGISTRNGGSGRRIAKGDAWTPTAPQPHDRPAGFSH